MDIYFIGKILLLLLGLFLLIGYIYLWVFVTSLEHGNGTPYLRVETNLAPISAS